MASRESEALPSLPFVFLLGWVYFYVFFFSFVFFWPFVFFLFFFFLCVSVCFVFLAGLGVGGVFLLALTFHRKCGPRAGCMAHPPRTKEQGVGRNRSYPRYQDGPGCWLAGSQASETRSLSGSWGLR